jgi:hypothetical protein
MPTTAIRIAFLRLPVLLPAQWLNVKTAGIPRTPDGKANLTAPAPRTQDAPSTCLGCGPLGQAVLIGFLRTTA